MSCLDCSCILRTRVESFGAEKHSEDSSSEDSADESAVFWSQSSRREDEQISWSSDVSHYDLQVEIGKGCNNLTSIYLARHVPTGTLVAVRITDLERCSEDHLKALQNEVTLSHAFRHPNIMTLWAVFTTGSWLWVISPFMAYTNLSGDCSLLSEMTRFKFGLKQHHQTCVRDRAVRSILAVRKVNKERAEKAVDEVFDACFSDHEPFGRVPHSKQDAKYAYRDFQNRHRYYTNV